MNKLIEFTVPGGTIVVESQDAAPSGTVRGAAAAQVVDKVGKSLVDALSVIRPVAEATIAACGGLQAQPEAVEVEFGLVFKAELDACIAKSSSEATLKIKLVWKPE